MPEDRAIAVVDTRRLGETVKDALLEAKLITRVGYGDKEPETTYMVFLVPVPKGFVAIQPDPTTPYVYFLAPAPEEEKPHG